MLAGDRASRHPRLVVELGMGDGRLLESLSRNDPGSLYVGIEIDREQFGLALSRVRSENTCLLNDSVLEIVPALAGGSIDMFLAVLPDPAFIDPAKSTRWTQFYAGLKDKLKPGGVLRIVTELTDELLQPVSDQSYAAWVCWLEQEFASLGFSVAMTPGSPPEYSSRCLDQFRGDPDRIRMVTIDLRKT